MDEFIRQMEEFGAQFNKAVIRLMYSPISQVMSLNFINLNPYNMERKANEKEIGDISSLRRRPE